MTNGNKQIPMLFHRITVVLLYVCFFYVQFSSYYNYATQLNASSFSPANKVIANNKIAISKTDGNQDRKVNIRLNKRFAPAPILYCQHNFTVTPVSYSLIKKCTVAYVALFIPASHLRINALRGPPVVA